MPVFKANFFEADPNKSAEENLNNLIVQYNGLITVLNRTVNNLDEENLNIDLKGVNNNG